MNILILGDSWGVPNFNGDKSVFSEYHHTEALLKNLGYNVHNCSLAGGSNFETVTRAQQYLRGEEIKHPAAPHSNAPEMFRDKKIKLDTVPLQVDWIIWFHTELARDLQNITVTNALGGLPRTTIKRISEYVYSKFFELKHLIGAKAIVIGGHAPLYPTFYNFGTAELCIPDWRGEILQTKFPNIQTLGQLDMVNDSNLSTEEKYDILLKHEYIIRAMYESNDFPDNSHPGARPHKELTERIHNFIQQYT
jgi:hypothetical protein